jgi:hypothetical protein
MVKQPAFFNFFLLILLFVEQIDGIPDPLVMSNCDRAWFHDADYNSWRSRAIG